MDATPTVIESREWYQLALPFLFFAYFECDHCHRPIKVWCQLEGENDWRDRLFDIQCACNWRPHELIPGSKTTHQFVVEWKREVHSLEEPR